MELQLGDKLKELFGMVGENLEQLKKDLTPTPLPSGSDVWEAGKKNGDTMREDIKNKSAEMATDVLQATPMGALAAGLIKGQKVFRGSYKKPEEFGNISRRFKEPGHEFGTHVSIDPKTADMFSTNIMSDSDKLRGFTYELESNVSKPLKLEDTGASWSPDRVADYIELATHRTARLDEKLKEGWKRFDDLPPTVRERNSWANRPDIKSNQLFKYDPKEPNKSLDTAFVRDDIEARFSKEGLAKIRAIGDSYRKEVDKYWENGSIRDEYKNLSEYIKHLDSSKAKEMQKVIRDEGYDHISYINRVEGEPVESAILFDEADENLLNIK